MGRTFLSDIAGAHIVDPTNNNVRASNSRFKGKCNGVGQECPTHTPHDEGARRSLICCKCSLSLRSTSSR